MNLSTMRNEFLVFIRRSLPKLKMTFPVLRFSIVTSDKRPYRNLTFRNVLARQGSSLYNRARLNFQAFALRVIEMGAQEDYRVGQKMTELSL